VKERFPDAATEHRLLEIRKEAAERGIVAARGIRPQSSPMPVAPVAPVASGETGYYGLPLLKEPTWTWEVPLYFFIGGAAGASAVIAAAAEWTGTSKSLVRDARTLAFAGALLSPPLLISDLGRPMRFLNMLRVFKWKSPMSVGAWTLVGFSNAAALAWLASRLERRRRKKSFAIGAVTQASTAAAAIFGLGMATYTGVLLGTTSVPLWADHAATLPIHFASSAMGSAASALELRGHRQPALNRLAIGAAAVETAMGIRVEGNRSVVSEPLRTGHSGITVRIGGLLSGPIPLALRLLGGPRMRRAAAASTLLGSLMTRIAWVGAGHVSVRDPRVPLSLEASVVRS
jgi:hypothetical protein